MQALLASGDGNLVYLEISEGDIKEKAHLKLDAEIACLDLSPLSTLLRVAKQCYLSPRAAVLCPVGPVYDIINLARHSHVVITPVVFVGTLSFEVSACLWRRAREVPNQFIHNLCR